MCLTEGWACPKCEGKDFDNAEFDDTNTYVKALTWRGLNHLARRQSIRENDGETIIIHWKIDMLDFWQKNHYKYLIIGHRLIVSKYWSSMYYFTCIIYKNRLDFL